MNRIECMLAVQELLRCLSLSASVTHVIFLANQNHSGAGEHNLQTRLETANQNERRHSSTFSVVTLAGMKRFSVNFLALILFKTIKSEMPLFLYCGL